MVLSPEVLLDPYYELTISGVKVSDDMKKYVTSVEFEESDSEADMARITVNDMNFIFSNQYNINEATPVTLIMGHEKHNNKMLDGQVSALEADFDEEGVQTLVITAMDKSNAMTSTKKSRTWKKVRRSDVVKQIAQEYGFEAVVQDTIEVHDQISQDNTTDAQFIANMADDEACQFYLIKGTKKLFFGQRFTGIQSAESLYYKTGDYSIRSFKPSFVEKNNGTNVASTNETSSDVSASSGQNVTKSTSSSSTTPPKVSKFVEIDSVTGKVTVR